MARRKRRRRTNSFKVPLATVGGLVGTMSVKGASGRSLIDALVSMDLDAIGYEAREKLAGVDLDGKFHPEWLVQSYGPLVVGGLISKFVGGRPLNLNQKLRDIPFIKI